MCIYCSGENDKSTQAAPDFPMSSLLLDSKVYLGRSACNTASLSLARMRNCEKVKMCMCMLTSFVCVG